MGARGAIWAHIQIYLWQVAKINRTIDNTDLSSKILCEQQGMTVSKTGGSPVPSPSVTPYLY